VDLHNPPIGSYDNEPKAYREVAGQKELLWLDPSPNTDDLALAADLSRWLDELPAK